MDKERAKTCLICSKEFAVDKYHPYQKVCSDPECQKTRQIAKQRKWRKKNPSYFKYKDKKTPWELRRYKYLKRWRETHKSYFRTYRMKNAKQNSA